MRYILNGNWNLTFTLPTGEKYETEAPVPGNAEPVLQRLGLIGDYMPADTEFAAERFEAVDDWTYTRRFDAPEIPAGHTASLVFEGIDTIAEVYLNGERVLDCEDMHMTYRLDVTGRLCPAGNVLTVVIRSSELWARGHLHNAFANAHGRTSYYDSQSFLRKPRHQWGWDNAPRLLTSGIVRPVYIEILPPCGFDEVYFYTKEITDTAAVLGVSWQYRTPALSLADHTVRVSLADEDGILTEETQRVTFVQGTHILFAPLSKTKLWWPADCGEPHLYTLRVEMRAGDTVTAVYETEVGIRTVQLRRTEDILPDGTGDFAFYVNGERIFIRGTNWKPLSPLASEADVKTREGKALAEIVNLHCNAVRIWGGGIYEDDFFFRFCDEHGILVWQDFMFACEIPVRDDAYCALAAKEAEQIVKKQRNHPSLAVWCGDNENDACVSWVHPGAHVLPSHSRVTREVLKNAVLCFDPYRDYVESSPFVSDAAHQGLGGLSADHTPEVHMYPQTPSLPKVLRESRCRFTGEVGPIDFNAITENPRLFEREKARMARLWDSPRLPHPTQSHQNDGYFTTWRNAGKRACLHFCGRDFSFDEWEDYTLAINLICAEAFKDVIEFSRVSRPEKTGVIWWSLTDMWPMLFNYSVIDCDGCRKMPYYWIKASQRAFTLMAVRREVEGELALYAVNDTLQPVTAEYTVTAYGKTGEGRQIASGICRAAGNTAPMIQRIAEEEEPALWILRFRDGTGAHANHVITGRADFETLRRWTEIIRREITE